MDIDALAGALGVETIPDAAAAAAAAPPTQLAPLGAFDSQPVVPPPTAGSSSSLAAVHGLAAPVAPSASGSAAPASGGGLSFKDLVVGLQNDPSLSDAVKAQILPMGDEYQSEEKKTFFSKLKDLVGKERITQVMNLLQNPSMSDARLIEALLHYPQRVAHELEHRRAVAAVQEQLAKYRQQVRKLEEAKSQQVRASQAQIARINDAAHQLIFESDVMIKSSDGSLCPANKAILLTSSRYFKARLDSAGAEMQDAQSVISLEATRDAVRTLMMELHLPHSTDPAKVDQAVAFEVLGLVQMMGGPEDPASEPQAAMHRIAGFFATAFVKNAPARPEDPQEVANFAQGLMLAMGHLERADGERWLRDAWREVARACATSLRSMMHSAAMERKCLAPLSPAALVKVLEVVPPSGLVSVHGGRKLISQWLWAKGAELPRMGKVSLSLDVRPGGTVGCVLHDTSLSTRPSRRDDWYKVVHHIRTRANGMDPNSFSDDELDNRLQQLGLGTEVLSELNSLDNSHRAKAHRLHDALSLLPPADQDFASLCVSLARSIAQHQPLGQLRVDRFDAKSLSCMLEQGDLKAQSELEVAEAFLKWAEVPGRDLAVIDKLAPHVRFPLIRVCPADPSIKERLGRLVQRSSVVKALVHEALALQQKVGAALPGKKQAVMTGFTPRKHALLEGEQVTVQRHKQRKLCMNDDVPGVSADDVLNASLSG